MNRWLMVWSVMHAAAYSAAAMLLCYVSPASGMEISRRLPGGGPIEAPLPPYQPPADPPDIARLRVAINLAWNDATRVWAELLGNDIIEAYQPRITFVPKVKATHCYGLYVSAGPVYCSANNTVFVSLEEMQRLERTLPGFGEGGLTLLVAHELGHHVQKVSGRFGLLSALMRSKAGDERELAKRFELEADCLAGLWAGHSRSGIVAPGARARLADAAEAIGDDRAAAAGVAPKDPARFTHGSAAERRRWFEIGLTAGSLDLCNVLTAPLDKPSTAPAPRP